MPVPCGPSESWVSESVAICSHSCPHPEQVHGLSIPDCCQALALACSEGPSPDNTEYLLMGVKVLRVWFHTIRPCATQVQGVMKQLVWLSPAGPCLPASPTPLGSCCATVQRQLLAQHADLVAQIGDPAQGKHQG